MSLTTQEVLEALRTVKYPGFTRDIVSFGIVKDLVVAEGRVRFRLELGPGNPAVADRLRRDAAAAVKGIAGVRGVDVVVGAGASAAEGLRMVGAQGPSRTDGTDADDALLPGVRNVVAIASGKGGVGKSTVAVNLAVALARTGAGVGLLDADIYGPSIPLMMGVDEPPRLDAEGRRIVPFDRHGVRFMSLGFLVQRDAAVIWRGPMVMKAIEQLLRDVAWGELDVLVVDLPPGTGDAQLTLAQRVRLSGAIIVTTPQDVALADAVKGVAMFRKVGVPVLGILENMSYFACPHCGQRTDIFGHGGGKAQAERLGVPFLGEIGLDPAIRDSGDTGRPLVGGDPDAIPSRAFLAVAETIRQRLETAASQDGPEAAGEGPFARPWKGRGDRER